MPIVERDKEGANQWFLTRTTATGRARDLYRQRSNTASLYSTTPLNKDYQSNMLGDSLPKRAHTTVERRGIMQVKVSSHKDSDTANDSPLGVPDKLGQETLRETAEALVLGQTASKTTVDYMRQAVETVPSQQLPVNHGQ
jgi:hypothetical protein